MSNRSQDPFWDQRSMKFRKKSNSMCTNTTALYWVVKKLCKKLLNLIYNLNGWAGYYFFSVFVDNCLFVYTGTKEKTQGKREYQCWISYSSGIT